MNKHIGWLVLITFTILGCSGGGGRDLGGGGRYCSLNSLAEFAALPAGSAELARYDKTAPTTAPEDVISATHLPEGTYELENAEFLYVRKEDPNNQRRWVMTQLREEIDTLSMTRRDREKGSAGETLYKTSIYCNGGYRIEDPTYEASAEGITKLQVSAGNKIDFEVTSWGYQYDGVEKMLKPLYVSTDANGQQNSSWKRPEDKSKYSAPKDVFTNNLSVLSLRRLAGGDGNAYQILSQLEIEEGKTYVVLRVNLKRK